MKTYKGFMMAQQSMIKQAQDMLKRMESHQTVHFYSNEPMKKLKAQLSLMTREEINRLVTSGPICHGHTALQTAAIYAPYVAIHMIQKLDLQIAKESLDQTHDDNIKTPRQILTNKGYNIDTLLKKNQIRSGFNGDKCNINQQKASPY
jgi:hypothetical protein